MNMSNRLISSVALAVCCFGAAVADEGKDESRKGKDRYYSDRAGEEKSTGMAESREKRKETGITPEWS